MPYRLRDLREDADLHQKDMAEKMFMHPNQYRRYESGESDIPLALAIRFASFFGVSLDYFAGLVSLSVSLRPRNRFRGDRPLRR